MTTHARAMLHMWVADLLGIVCDVFDHPHYNICQWTETHMDIAHRLYYNGDRCQYEWCSECAARRLGYE